MGFLLGIVDESLERIVGAGAEKGASAIEAGEDESIGVLEVGGGHHDFDQKEDHRNGC